MTICPKCKGRATKIINMNTDNVTCQQCDHTWKSNARIEKSMEQIKEVCSNYGYGFVIQQAARMWDEIQPGFGTAHTHQPSESLQGGIERLEALSARFRDHDSGVSLDLDEIVEHLKNT